MLCISVFSLLVASVTGSVGRLAAEGVDAKTSAAVLLEVRGARIDEESNGLLLPSAQDVYKTVGGRDLKVDVYKPNHSAQPTKHTAALLPGVVFIHSGAWMKSMGSMNLTMTARKLLRLGFLVVSVEYRLVGDAGVSTSWPAQGEDVADAMTFVRRNAQTYGIDPDRLGCLGHSSGAHLCAWLAVAPPVDEMRPNVAVAMSTPTCFLCPGEQLLGRTPADWLFGFQPGTLRKLKALPANAPDTPDSGKLDLVHSAEPLWHLQHRDESLAVKPRPLFLVHGKEDDRVPVTKTTWIADEYRAQGFEVHVRYVDGGTHEEESLAGGTDGPEGAIDFLANRLGLAKQQRESSTFLVAKPKSSEVPILTLPAL